MDPEISGVAAVVLGNFNPQIFQPAWFASQELVSKEEADDAEIDVIIPDLSSFTVGPFSLRASRDKFHVYSANAPSFDVVRDVVFGTFELLPHTPVRAVGLNRQYHYRMEDEDSWHGLGFRLVPRKNWEGVLETPGMEHVRVLGARPDSERPGMVRVTVQPSVKINPGVYMEVNDHFELDGDDEASKLKYLLELLKDEWEVSMKRSQEIADHVLAGP